MFEHKFMLFSKVGLSRFGVSYIYLECYDDRHMKVTKVYRCNNQVSNLTKKSVFLEYTFLIHMSDRSKKCVI